MKEIPRICFAHLPTYIEFLPRISAYLGGARIYIKRDDQTGLAFGGNKTRKLEYLVADAQANNAKTLITAGAIQSNHCRQTAAAAAKFGFECILVLTGQDLKSKMSQEPLVRGNQLSDPNILPPSGNLLLDYLFGAQIVWTTPDQRENALQDAYTKAEKQSKRPYLIPYGGSNPIGAMGYVTAMQELTQQLKSNTALAYPHWIVFPSSSGGTQAGLTLGARLFGYRGKVLGISVDEPQTVLKERVAQLANMSAKFVEEKRTFTVDEILVNDHYLGGGYGVMGKPEQEAIQLFGKYEGIILDPVYTGRAAAGLIDLVRTGFFSSDEVILFWHTGGSSAIFAHRYESELFSSGR
ncbi:MAG: D-cysteine desulfhydrase family protein [Anaerolineales bacterium]|nr:D-cysteine desulfhydrase family protein [Anaerolineales bacterium]